MGNVGKQFFFWESDPDVQLLVFRPSDWCVLICKKEKIFLPLLPPMHALSVFSACAAYWGEKLCHICTILTEAAPAQFLPAAFRCSWGRILPTYHWVVFSAPASGSWMVPVILGNIALRVQSAEALAGSKHFPELVQQSQKTSVSPSTADPLNEYCNLFIQVFEEKTQHTVSGISDWECMWQLYQEYWEIPISLAVLSATHNWLQ